MDKVEGGEGLVGLDGVIDFRVNWECPSWVRVTWVGIDIRECLNIWRGGWVTVYL